jgi:hypothetical protein
MSKILKLLAGLALFASVSASASAQWMVFDPTNWVQNYATAVQTLEQYKQMVQQVINSGIELKGLGNIDAWKAAAVGALTNTQLGQAVVATQNLISGINNGQSSAQNLLAAYGASGTGSFQDWVAGLNQQGGIATQTVQALAQSVSTSNQSIQDAQKQWENANSKLASTPGLVGQMQLVNQSLMTLIQQNNAVNATLAAMAANDAQKTTKDNASVMSGAQAAAQQALQNTIDQGNQWFSQKYGQSGSVMGVESKTGQKQ